MNNMNFVKGMGLGILVGGAVSMAMNTKRSSKTGMGSMLRSVGEVIENITDAMGF